MEKLRIIVTKPTEEQFQRLLDDQEIAKELQKIVDSRHFDESTKGLINDIKQISLIVGNTEVEWKKFLQSTKEEFKKEIINFALRKSFSKCIGDLLHLNIREDVLNQLRNEENVKEIINEVNSALEESFRSTIREIITSGTGPLGEIFAD